MRDLEELFAVLAKSTFRASFKLNSKDMAYLQQKGISTVLDHAEDFIKSRLAPAMIENDGKQTPMRGHPVLRAHPRRIRLPVP